MGKKDPIWSAILESSKESCYQDVWILDLKWHQILRESYPQFRNDNTFTALKVKRKLKAKGDIYDSGSFDHPNDVGMFRVEYSLPVCPISGKHRNATFYKFIKASKVPKYPTEPTGGVFLKNNKQELIPDTPLRTTTRGGAKRRVDLEPSLRVSPSKHQKVRESLGPRVFNHWYSKESRNLFVNDPSFEGDVSLVLKGYRRKLLEAIDNHDYTEVVTGLNGNNQDTMNEHDRTAVLNMCAFLARAYKHALEQMPHGATWEKCCKDACQEVNEFGFRKTSQSRVVREWSKMFVCNGGKFAHPNPEKLKPKKYVPLIFTLCPESRDMVVDFATKNLADLTAEALREEFKDNILPKLKAEFTTDLNREYLDYLSDNIPCGETFRKWIKEGLGWSQDGAKKSFYVDDHENPEQRAARKAFVKRYMEELEPHMHRFIQVTEEEVDEAMANSQLPQHFKRFGKKYDSNGTTMYEFHVDDHDWFFNYGDKKYEFGAQLSMFRKLEEGRDVRPLILWGHDECSFSQYLLRVKQWITAEGQRPLCPKTEGENYMVSAFTCREFGFALELTEEELKMVNRYRSGQHYDCKQAAREVDKNGRTEKQDLTSTPFIRFFESGFKYDGYWNNRHMVIQFEDCMDVLKAIPRFKKFRHKFLFDSSTGHTARREDGLRTEKMTKGWGGYSNPRNFHSVTLTDHSYTGAHLADIPEDEAVTIPCEYHFNFKEDDKGPAVMKSEQEREERRYNRPNPDAGKRKKSKDQLVKELLEADPANLKVSQFNNGPLSRAAAVRDLAGKYNIPLEEDVQIEGWVGSPKGMWQILWERGFIDPANKSKYTMTNEDPKYSLTDLVANLRDFKEERSLIQELAFTYGFEAIFTPKYHAEIAGCGIEYIWGAAKARYRSFTLNKKKKRPNFINSVHEALQVISLTTARKCDRKARTYIRAYYTLEVLGMNPDGSDRNDDDTITLPDIKKLVKRYRTHRSALDFDYKFIKDLLKSFS